MNELPVVILTYERGTKAWTRLRKILFLRDGGKCYLCGIRLTPMNQQGRDKPTAYTLDHVIPVSKGGQTSPDNLRACCQKCNTDKADRLHSAASCTG